jgi:hypothetical protein
MKLPPHKILHKPSKSWKRNYNLSMNITRTIAILATISLASSVFAGNQVAINNILNLQQSGVNSSVLTSYINSKNETYDLDANDIIQLKQAGVPDDVISLMLSHTTTSATPLPATTVPTDGSLQPTTVTVPADPEVQDFYSQLAPYGTWVNLDGTYYWQPNNVNIDWTPYDTGGNWQYTDSGWYWQSTYAWGWAPFHYGRWLHSRHGWLWRPDHNWGPAWVIWRNSGDYVGWAPMPPGATLTENGLQFHGTAVGSDFSFNLTAQDFSFCAITEINSPTRHHFRGESATHIFAASTPSPVHVRPVEINGHTIYTHGPKLEGQEPVKLDVNLIRVPEHNTVIKSERPDPWNDAKHSSPDMQKPRQENLNPGYRPVKVQETQDLRNKHNAPDKLNQ